MEAGRTGATDWRGLLLDLYLPSALVGVAQGLIPPAIPALAAHHNVPPTLAVQVVTALLLGRFATFVPSGLLADRFGPRVAMVAGASLLVLAGAATTLAPAFGLVLAGQAVAGVALGLWQVGRELAAVDLVTIHRRGTLLSSYFGIASAGQALGPLLGGVAVDAIGPVTVFALQAVTGIVVLALALRHGLPPVRALHRQSGPVLPRLGNLDPTWRVTFMVLMVGTFAAQLRNGTLSGLLPLIGAGAGLSGTDVGVLFAIVAVMNLIVVGPAGYISDRVGRKASTVPAAALTAVAFFLYPFAKGFVPLAALSVLVGLATGASQGSMTTSTYDITPPRSRGAFQGVRRMAGDLGALVGPSAGGLVASFTSVGMAFLAFAPLHLVAAALLLFVARESLPKRKV